MCRLQQNNRHTTERGCQSILETTSIPPLKNGNAATRHVMLINRESVLNVMIKMMRESTKEIEGQNLEAPLSRRCGMICRTDGKVMFPMVGSLRKYLQVDVDGTGASRRMEQASTIASRIRSRRRRSYRCLSRVEKKGVCRSTKASKMINCEGQKGDAV